MISTSLAPSRRFVALTAIAIALCLTLIALTGPALAGHGPKPVPLKTLKKKCKKATKAKISRKTFRRTIVCLHNVERKAHGLKKLKANKKLTRAATGHARDMTRRDYLNHVTPEGVTPRDRADRQGYKGGVGENMNFYFNGRRKTTPLDLFKFWLTSPGHHANILTPYYRDIGVGLSRGTPFTGNGGLTIVINFGQPF